MLTVSEPLSTLGRLWADALERVLVRHPNPEARPQVSISGDEQPIMVVSVSSHRDTNAAYVASAPGGIWESFVISNVRLTYFPGVALARAWFAAAWSGYIQHEALELVTVDGKAVLDPHSQPYRLNPCNRGLRDGFPSELTPAALVAGLAVTMPDRDAADLVRVLWATR